MVLSDCSVGHHNITVDTHECIYMRYQGEGGRTRVWSKSGMKIYFSVNTVSRYHLKVKWLGLGVELGK